MHEVFLRTFFLSVLIFGGSGCQPSHKLVPQQNSVDSPSTNVLEETKPCIKESDIFESSLHPFLVENCVSCHASGGSGNGAFADAGQMSLAFSEYQLRGAQLIIDRALDSSHQPPFTGPQHTTTLDEISSQLSEAKVSCDAEETEDDPETETSNYLTVEKLAPQQEQNTEIKFNLPADFVSPVETTAFEVSFQVRVNTSVSGERTYHVSSPMVSASNQALLLSGISFYLNGTLVSEANGYLNQQVRVPSNDQRMLSASSVIFNQTPNIGDRLGIKIESIELIGFNPPAFSDLLAAGGVFAENCLGCHSGGNPSAGLDISNLAQLIGFNYVIPGNIDQGQLLGRMQSASAPMPPQGRLSEQEINLVKDWVLDGAAQ